MPKYSCDLDTKKFEAGYRATLVRIRAGDRREERRLADIVVTQAIVPIWSGELKASGYTRGEIFGWSARHAVYVEYGTNDTPAFAFARNSEQRAAMQLRSPI